MRLHTKILMWVFTFGCGADTDQSKVFDYDSGMIESILADVSNDLDQDTISSTDGKLSGRWAQKTQLSGIAEVPVLGFQRTDTIGLALVDIYTEFDSNWATVKNCQTSIERDDDIVTTDIPQAFIDSLPVYFRGVFVSENTIKFSKMVELNGINLKDPLNDLLPTDPNDERIYDQDLDGHPGVTVFVNGLVSGQIHLIQRTITDLSGSQNGRTIEGQVRWRIDESILGTDQPLLSMGAPITPNPNPDLSRFQLIKVSDELTCAELIESEGSLFNPTSEPIFSD